MPAASPENVSGKTLPASPTCRMPSPCGRQGPRALGIRAGYLSLLSLTLLAGCLFSERGGEPRGGTGPGDGDWAEARLVLRTASLTGSSAAASAVDSVAVRVAGDGMEPLEFGFSGSALSVNLAGIPPGSGRSVTAALFRRGRLLYLGSTLADFSREAPAELTLRCQPQFSRVVASFHLPPSLPLKVADGQLTLKGGSGEFQASLQRKGEFGTFELDEVPGDLRSDVSLVLTDAAGKPVYESRQAGLLLPLGEEAHWELSLLPTDATAGLVLELPRPRETRVAAAFPSRLGKPAAAGDLVITEFYAAPSASDSGSEGEWWEIFNRTADSLSLAGCRLTRTRGGGVTQSFPFDSAHRIPPGRAQTFGRSAAPADFHYTDFSLVNTASPLLLLCAGDSLVVDSLRYSATVSDSTAAPMREGFVTSLDIDSLARGVSRGSWCLTRMAGTAGSAGTASPGRVADCQE